MLENLRRDLRLAFRIFVQSPGFALAAVAALTLGIGVNTAIFSVVNAVLLRPLPFPEADRLVYFMSTSQRGASTAASPAKFAHFRQQDAVIEQVAAFNAGTVNDTGGGFPEQLRSARVSREFFPLFGAPFRLGRGFAAEEDAPRGPRVAILSERLWKDRYDGAADVVGEAISLGGEPYTIVGVLGDFHFEDLGYTPQVFVPFQLDPETADQGHYFRAAGRLKAGVTLEQARARVKASWAAWVSRHPGAAGGPNNGFSVERVGDVLVRQVRQSLLVLAGAVAFVLLIACANVANLLLARASGRQREVAIRRALGGSSARIVSQMLTESVVLSLAGGVLGLLFGSLGIRALLAINTADLPRVGDDGSLVPLDWRVLVFTLVTSVGTGLLFGLIPALHGTRADLGSTLKEGGTRSGGGSVRQNKTRAALVVAEVALALTLLIGSALLIRTAMALGHVDPGFDAKQVLTMRMALTGPRFARSEGVEQLVRDGVERLGNVPGVVAASATCCVPLEGGYGLPFKIVGRPSEGPFHGGGQWMTISPGYFDVFRIPVKRGRAFERRDDGAAPAVVVINEAMARQYWPKADPLGERLVIGRGVMREFADEPERVIVGIVGDTRDGGLNSDPGPAMYIPQAQVPDAANALNVGLTPIAWVVRTLGDPMAVSAAVQEQLRQASGLPVSEVRPMTEVVSLSTSRERFNMWLMTLFGVSALVLAAIGIYGLMAYSVEQRTRELGIRMALGADAGSVRALVVRQGMALAGAGIVLGLAAAFALARLIESFLFGVTRSDPMVFAAAPLLLLATAFLAVWLPALRASRVDPTVALRSE
ncbi:MAG: ABC transporter permease [Vicinamibacteria bacterium]